MTNIEEEFGALCAFPWIASERSKDEIIGRWAEDGSHYEVTEPCEANDGCNCELKRLRDAFNAAKAITQLRYPSVRTKESVPADKRAARYRQVRFCSLRGPLANSIAIAMAERSE